MKTGFGRRKTSFATIALLRKAKRHTTVVIVEDVERESGSLIET